MQIPRRRKYTGQILEYIKKGKEEGSDLRLVNNSSDINLTEINDKLLMLNLTDLDIFTEKN